MAAPTHYIGTVTVWGLDGTMAYTGIATTANLLESASYEDTTEEHEAKDRWGEVVGVKLFNPRENLTINFFPSSVAGSASIAAAAANVLLPPKGAKVTIADMPGSHLDAATWLYLGGGNIELSNSGDVKMVLPLRKYRTDIAATANT